MSSHKERKESGLLDSSGSIGEFALENSSGESEPRRHEGTKYNLERVKRDFTGGDLSLLLPIYPNLFSLCDFEPLWLTPSLQEDHISR